MKTLKRILSMMIIVGLIFSFPAASLAENADHAGYEEADSAGNRLAVREIDPRSLKVPRLGNKPGGSPEPAQEEALYGPDEMVRVSILLEKPSVLDAGFSLQKIAAGPESREYRDGLIAGQERIAEQISDTVPGVGKLDIKWHLTLAENMISANIPYGAVESVKAVKGVSDVILENRYEAPVGDPAAESAGQASVRSLGINLKNGSSDSTYTGAGSRIAIIDTGLDWEHISFDPEAFLHAIEEDRAAGKTVDLMTAEDIPAEGLNGKGVYLNEKLPYVYNYIDGNTTIDHVHDTQREHGSHVSGIAAANRYLKNEDQFVDAAETVGVVGQAPDAQVLVMKIFGSGGGAYDSDYMAAIEDALVLGADSISLSVGSNVPGPVTVANSVYRAAFQRLEESGLVLSTAIGSNGSWDAAKPLYADDINLYTGSVPGSYANTLTAASADNRSEAGQTEAGSYKLSSFSGWGVPGALVLKPEITAVGGSVLSLNGHHKIADESYGGGYDKYELMSDTSLAAAQIAGITSVLGQYYRENNLGEKTGLSFRRFAQSVIMSTAVPLKEEGSDRYYPVLAQGAGFADGNAALQTKTFILMDENAASGALDGKVKAELGDDPGRTGEYTYSFTLNNFGDTAVSYQIGTDLFTQALAEEGQILSHQTEALSADETITWTVGGSAAPAGSYTVPANGSASVTVSFRLTDSQKAALDNSLRKGAYIEGFTILEGSDGVTHSIPVLGFYGSWTDPSMFDAVTYTEKLYGSEQSSYFLGQETDTNLLYVHYPQNEEDVSFSGNPYVKEEVFPEDRLALNSETVITRAVYNLVRPAGTIFSALTGEGGEIYKLGSLNSRMNAAYYNTRLDVPAWQNISPVSINLNQSIGAFEISEGSRFASGFYALPEYYALKAGVTDGYRLSEEHVRSLLSGNTLGEGAHIGYTFTLDNTAPVISEPVKNADGTITFSVRDDRYTAAVGIMDMTGKKIFVPLFVPEQQTAGENCEITFDPEACGAAGANAAVIFAADYAGNETAVMVKTGDGPAVIQRDAYVLTNSIKDGKEYIIASVNAAGTGYVLLRNGSSSVGAIVSVSAPDGRFTAPYIDEEQAVDSVIWKFTASGNGFKIQQDEYFLRQNRGSLSISTADSNNIWTWDKANNRLSVPYNGSARYLRWYNSAFSLNTSVNSVYLYEKVTYAVPVEGTAASVQGASASFAGEIRSNLYVYIPEEILADQKAYAEITFNGAKTTFLLSSITSRTQVNFVPCFRFQIPVKAKELRDEAVLKIFTGSNEPVFLLNQNGEDVTDKGAAYSVQDYLTRIQKTGSATMIKLAKAAEDYGIAAQLYFKYKHDGLTIPENVTAVTPGEMAVHAPAEQGTLPAGITKSANSVLFQSDNTLRMYYFYNSGTALSKYTCTVDGKAGKITNQPDSLRFYVQYPAIAAKNLDDVHTFVITDSKSTHTYKISAVGYAYKMVTTSKDPTMVDLAKALYLYNIAAVEHLGK